MKQSSIYYYNYVIFPVMGEFSDRLRAEIDYAGLSQKELAAKAGLKERALYGYFGPQQSMPPADVAVKIAAALGFTVEYLVTGKFVQQTIDISKYIRNRDILDDLDALPPDILIPIKAMIKSAAGCAREKTAPVC